MKAIEIQTKYWISRKIVANVAVRNSVNVKGLRQAMKVELSRTAGGAKQNAGLILPFVRNEFLTSLGAGILSWQEREARQSESAGLRCFGNNSMRSQTSGPKSNSFPRSLTVMKAERVDNLFRS